MLVVVVTGPGRPADRSGNNEAEQADQKPDTTALVGSYIRAQDVTVEEAAVLLRTAHAFASPTSVDNPFASGQRTAYILHGCPATFESRLANAHRLQLGVKNLAGTVGLH